MSLRPRLRLPGWIVVVALGIGLGWTGLLGLQHLEGRASVLDRIEATFVDLRLLAFGPRAPPPQIAIVAIDDAMVDAEGGYPIDRRRLARLIEAIRDGGAVALAIDLLLVDGPAEPGNAALAEALGTLPAVIAAAGRFERGAGSGVPRTTGEMWPLPAFADAAGVGLATVATDPGGTPRHVPMVFLTEAGPAPSLALRAVGLYTGQSAVFDRERIRVGDGIHRLDLNWHLALRYYGPEGSIVTIDGSSLIRDADGNGLLEGRLVVLGTTATAVGDRFGTPFDRVLPGVEVLATAMANLLDGSGLIRDRRIRQVDVAAMLALTAAGLLILAGLPMVAGLLLFAGLLVGWLITATVLFGQSYWFSIVLPLAGAVPVVAILATMRELHDRRAARVVARSEAALARMQDPALARRIAEDPAFLLQPVELPAAIVFVDLAGFTGLSERLGVSETQRFLSEFHELVVRESHAHGGSVLGFMGDGAMVVFGIPAPRADDAARALRAAHALVAAVRGWTPEAGAGTVRPDLRAGAHHGPVILSRLGNERHQHVTVAGDSVNTASRLMDLCKQHEARVAASADLVAAAGVTDPLRRPADAELDVRIRGRHQSMKAHFWREAWQESRHGPGGG